MREEETAITPIASLTEIEKVQNPALGAWLLWEYGRRFQSTTESASSHFLLFFLILPLCLHRPTLDAINSTLENSGLGKFCEKMGAKREELLAVHDRAYKLRALSLSSISFGVSAGLLSVDYERGTLRSLEVKFPKVPDLIKPHGKGAVKLGAWFSAVDEASVFKSLKVDI